MAERLKLVVGVAALLAIVAISSAWFLMKRNSANHFYDEAKAEFQAGRNADAAQWFHRAAQLGETRSMVQLGQLYLNGKGLTRNENEAMQWFQKAADAGDPSGMFFLGGMYHLGTGVARNYLTAIAWYRRAAEAGNPDAMYILGKMYENGDGITTDLNSANQFYRKAIINRGLTTAQVRAILGMPLTIASLGIKEIYVYRDLKVTLRNDKVVDVIDLY